MTKKEINKKLAEIAGFTQIREGEFGELEGLFKNEYGDHWLLIPNYCEDLNALRTIETELSLDERCSMSCLLHKLHSHPYEDLGAIFSTARERAEIILKVKDGQRK